MKYILKNGDIIESIPIGRSSIKIGERPNGKILTVVDRGPNKENSRQARAICKCDCGKYTILPISELRYGSTLSCGCYGKKQKQELCKELGKKQYFKDYTQIENPFYIFISPTNQKTNIGQIWNIECKKCHSQYLEIPSQLISLTRNRGNNPCLCWKNISKGELKIIQILNENNIKYKQQKIFKDCLSDKNNFLRFDFYINNQYIIEYDGEQHFIPISFGSQIETKEEKFEKIKKYDKIKNDYCKKNNISLIRIPYTHYNELNIKDLLLETSNFIIKEDVNE